MFNLAYDNVSAASFSAEGLQTSPSQSTQSLATNDYVISNAVFEEEEKDPLGLVEEVSQQLDHMDSTHPGSSDEQVPQDSSETDIQQASTETNQSQHASASHSEQQEDNLEESSMAQETTNQPPSSDTIIFTNTNALEMTKM